MGSIRPNLPDISHLPPPGLREIYWALSSGSLGLGVHLREQPRFASLERKFEDNGLPGKHALGWYMYWLKTCRAHCRNSANVLTMWTLMSGRMSDAFLDSFPKYPTAAYEGVLSVSSAGYWQNAPLILRYVLLLSASRQAAARLRGEAALQVEQRLADGGMDGDGRGRLRGGGVAQRHHFGVRCTGALGGALAE